MFLSDSKHAVLAALRRGPLDQHQLAADLQLAPWKAREELDALKRDRLVERRFERRRVVWMLTGRGLATVQRHDQLRLGEAA